MKLLRRNMTEFTYYPHSGETSDLDEHGRHTGHYEPVHAEPVQCLGNISIPNGETMHAFYGEDIRYTHSLLMEDPDAPIDEYGVIEWKGHRYDILAVRRSLNNLSAALKRQTESHDEPDEDPDDGSDDGG